jgi:chitinase
MIWALDIDDFMPECSNIRYPLLRAIHSEFKAASISGMATDKTPVTD